MKTILIDSKPVGRGKERTCYVHPEDPSKLIKISGPETDIQTRREIDFYTRLARRKGVEYSHIPRYYGTVSTSLGQGIVVDAIRDFNQDISKTVSWYLDNKEHTLLELEPLFVELREYLLENLIIFNHDLTSGNILIQKLAGDAKRLVAIDGLGDVVFIQVLNNFAPLARNKIKRRWDRFYSRMMRGD